jgi:SAM-dependent methyltransferase
MNIIPRMDTSNVALAYDVARLELQKRGLGRLMHAVRRNNLTYPTYERLSNICRIVLDIERNEIAGEFLEAGCALGGSSILIARAKQRSRPLFVYDVFEMIPPPSGRDGADAQGRYQAIAAGKSAGIGGDAYYGYVDNLLDGVIASFRRFSCEPKSNNVQFVKGLYQETLTSTAPVAFAHVDCDWYDSVLTCLKNIVPRLVPGGSIIIDDYLDWSGCRKAVDEYFSAPANEGFTFNVTSHLHIRRVAG